PHLVECPEEVDGSRPRGPKDLLRLVQVVPTELRERHAVGGRDADRGRAADGKRLDRLRELGDRRADEVDLLLGQPPLVEQDDGGPLLVEADDPLRKQRAGRLRARPRTVDQVPSSHEARYFACSSVSWSISM